MTRLRCATDVWTLDCADVGLNSLLALDGEMLANMARALGQDAEAERFATRSEALKARIRERLWDRERRVFANRLWSGKFTASLAPTSFYPLICGRGERGAGARDASALERRHEIRRHLAAALLHARRPGHSRTTSTGAAASGRR